MYFCDKKIFSTLRGEGEIHIISLCNKFEAWIIIIKLKYLSCFYFLFQPLSQAYHDLALAYATNSPDEVRAVISKHNEIFDRVSILCKLL